MTSRTGILRLSREWPGLLKWPATGFSVRVCVMSFRSPLRWMWRGFCVSPTYCFRHFLHSIKHITFLVLQVAVARTLKAWLVVVLRMLVVHLDVAAGEAAPGATRPASTGWLESGWLEHCLGQEIPKVLWSSVGYPGAVRG